MNELKNIATRKEIERIYVKYKFRLNAINSLQDTRSDILYAIYQTKKDMEILLNVLQKIISPSEHWIPISERLPENDCVVLISFDDGSVKSYYQRWKAWQDEIGESAFVYCEDIFDKDIPTTQKKAIAWMPMPEAYKAPYKPEPLKRELKKDRSWIGNVLNKFLAVR